MSITHRLAATADTPKQQRSMLMHDSNSGGLLFHNSNCSATHCERGLELGVRGGSTSFFSSPPMPRPDPSVFRTISTESLSIQLSFAASPGPKNPVNLSSRSCHCVHSAMFVSMTYQSYMQFLRE